MAKNFQSLFLVHFFLTTFTELTIAIFFDIKNLTSQTSKISQTKIWPDKKCAEEELMRA